MKRFWIQGVVKDGQVVLAQPLDIPDGTVVTVQDSDPDADPRPAGLTGPFTDEQILQILGDYTGRPDLIAECLRRQLPGEAA